MTNIAWIWNLWKEQIPKSWEWGFEAINKALDLLWRPETQAKMRIIVWWSVGKGSTVAYNHAILTKLWYKVASFSSPHVVDVRERIRLGNAYISENEINEIGLNLLNTLKANGVSMSYFAFWYLLYILSSQKFWAEILNMEVWCGWEWDCTNASRGSRIVALTCIGDDHLGLLGNTRREIAETKAKIFNAETIAGYSYESEFREVLDAISPIQINYIPNTWEESNKMLALRICEHIAWKKINDEDMNIYLPARWDIRTFGKVQVVFDWAHSTLRVQNILPKFKKMPWNKSLILAVKSDKDWKFLLPLLPFASKVYLTSFDDSLSPLKLRDALNCWEIVESPIEAFKKAIKESDSILICWSFYLAWELLRYMASQSE